MKLGYHELCIVAEALEEAGIVKVDWKKFLKLEKKVLNIEFEKCDI